MSAKKSRAKNHEKTLKNINLTQLKKELAELENKAKDQYRPKYGRQMKRLHKKIQKAS